jgi:Rrf2 family protein
MRISQKAHYAVRAALDLTLYAPVDRGARSSEIARRTGVPEKFLEAVLRDLAKAGVAASKRGPDGGHWLARDPSRLTVSAIVQAIDGPLSPARRTSRSTAPEAACIIALWKKAEQAVLGVLDKVTLDDLRREVASNDVLDFTI